MQSLRYITNRPLVSEFKRLKYFFILLIFFSANSFADIKMSQTLANDIGRTYGYFIGQKYSLSQISKRFPHLSKDASLAEQEFLFSFKPSIDGLDSFMSNSSKEEWGEIKSKLQVNIPEALSSKLSLITESDAINFITEVKQRAKGHIESPILETLLIFKKGYQEKPEREFLDGYKYRYESDGTGKAKDVAFSIEIPKTWVSKEARRPNIVQKFISENGRGFEHIMILIKEIPMEDGQRITQQDVADMLNSDDIKSFLPKDATYYNSGELTLETLPGFWITYKISRSRVRSKFEMEAIWYAFFYKNKMISIQGQVATNINVDRIKNGGIQKYERLFDLVANSLVIPDLYNKRHPLM